MGERGEEGDAKENPVSRSTESDTIYKYSPRRRRLHNNNNNNNNNSM